MAHGNGDRTVQAALNAGVDTLEHGNYMEEETLCQLAESETIWVPTFSPIGNLVGCGRFPDEQVKGYPETGSRRQYSLLSSAARGLAWAVIPAHIWCPMGRDLWMSMRL